MAKCILLQAKSSGVSEKLRKRVQEYRSTEDRLMTELGRTPTLEEIALRLNITAEEADAIRNVMDDALILNQIKKPREEADPNTEDLAIEDTAYFQMRQRVSDLLSLLSDEDAQILTLRFGLEKGIPISQEETARQLHMTTKQVIDREAKALALLRNQHE